MRILIPIVLGLLIALAIGYGTKSFVVGGAIGVGVAVAIGVVMSRKPPPANPNF